MAESIPTTEILYGWISGYSFPTPGIYVIATETNPVEMLQNYTNRSAYYEMVKEHVTTEASVEDFVSILVSRGMFSTGGYGFEIKSIEKMDYAFVLNASFRDPGLECYVFQWITNPTALIPIGNLPAGEYFVTLHIDKYIVHCSDETSREYIGTETWTATFIVVGTSFPCSEYIALNATYHALLANYSDLLDNYSSMLNNYNALLTDHSDLQDDYDVLLDSHDVLVAYFDSLNSSYYGLQSSYESLNSTYYDLLDMYNQFQSDYDDLESQHDTLTGDLGTTRNLSYAFIMTTIVFIATTVYLAIRKPKVKPESKAT